MKFLCLEIDRKTDFLAFTAFIVSVLTATYQVGVLLFGPSAQLLKPEGATITQYEASPGQVYMALIAPITISNMSDAREPLLVTRQTVAIKIGQTTISLVWHQVGNVSDDFSTSGLDFKAERDVSPFVVDTKGIASDIVLFTPQRTPCVAGTPKCTKNAEFVSLGQFQTMLDNALEERIEKMTIDFTAEFANDDALTVSCSIALRPTFYFELSESGYISELCLQE